MTKYLTAPLIGTLLLLGAASAKNFSTTAPVKPAPAPAAYSAQQRFANYVKNYPQDGVVSGKAAESLCATPRGILQRQAAADQKSGKGYWAVGDSMTWVVKNHAGVSLELMDWDSLAQPESYESLVDIDEPRLEMDTHATGTVTFERMTGQAFDVDVFEFDSDPSTYGQPRVCLTILNAKK